MLILSALLVLSVSCGKTKKNTISANSGGYNTTQNLNAETTPTYSDDPKYHFTQYANIHYRFDYLEDKLQDYGIDIAVKPIYDGQEEGIITNRKGKIRHSIKKRHRPDIYAERCQKEKNRNKKSCQPKRFFEPVFPEACDNLMQVKVNILRTKGYYSASDLQAISELVNDYNAYATDYYQAHAGLADKECLDIERGKAVAYELEKMLSTFSASKAGLTEQK